jgi:hypothetical protein
MSTRKTKMQKYNDKKVNGGMGETGNYRPFSDSPVPLFV